MQLQSSGSSAGVGRAKMDLRTHVALGWVSLSAHINLTIAYDIDVFAWGIVTSGMN